MKTLRLLISISLAAFLSACSSNPSAPTEADARAAVEQDIERFSQGCIKLVEFQKTGEKGIESMMVVYASAKIEFLDDCNWPIDTIVLVNKLVPGSTPNVRKGEQRAVNLTIHFQKTKSGWKATQGKDPRSTLPQ